MSYETTVTFNVTANDSTNNTVVVNESATASLTLSNYIKVDIPISGNGSAPGDGTTAIKAIQDLTQKEFIVIIPSVAVKIALWASPTFTSGDKFIQIPANFPFIMQTNTSATFTDLYVYNTTSSPITLRVIAGDKT